jgi:phosphoribosylaminoimidazole-succinocarboxamide synthase
MNISEIPTLAGLPEIPGFTKHRGKVREVIDLNDGRLALVATDCLSAFDIVGKRAIPHKGRVLTCMTEFWLTWLGGNGIAHHMLSTNVRELPADLIGALEDAEEFRGVDPATALAGRTMIVRKLEPLAVEAIARAYLTGSGLKDYKKTGKVCGIDLPFGLVEASELPESIFTPSTKESGGKHDRNISFDEMVEILGDKGLAQSVRSMTLGVFDSARALAKERGIILADTKFEWAFDKARGLLVLIDEVLTPDSSRFWPLEGYEAGKVQPSFDKQPIRDYLETEKVAGRWDGASAFDLPNEIVAATTARYIKAFEMLTGMKFPYAD